MSTVERSVVHGRCGAGTGAREVSGVAAGRSEDIARFFDREVCCAARRRTVRRGPGRASRVLLTELEALELDGRSVLDVGCGPGALSVAFVQRGATVTGVDLSSASVAEARRAGRHLAERLRFEVADAASATLTAHDVVVLNKVVCCYFDASALLRNTLPPARRALAMTLPCSLGLRGVAARLLLGAENGWRRLRGEPFRAFVHDVGAVAAVITADGFRMVSHRQVGIWSVAVFVR